MEQVTDIEKLIKLGNNTHTIPVSTDIESAIKSLETRMPNMMAKIEQHKDKIDQLLFEASLEQSLIDNADVLKQLADE